LGTWTLVQIVIDIFLALGVFVVVMRMNRAPKDDPRLSRGLQLLQSKIAVLEDLSDRTEVQVNQLNAILEQKAREVQAKVQLAEQHVHEIRVAMDRSLEVAKIFQDKIPHQEIIERQSTMKYVQAARLAHQGLGVDEIAAQVELPKGEIEFIAKVNRDNLMFNEEQLPWWAKDNSGQSAFIEEGAVATGVEAAAGAPVFDTPVVGASPGDPAEDAARIRAEMELAEQQRLVENLSRLQFEMQNLDMQLSGKGTGRDFSSAFEASKTPTESLQKLGEEFRRACDAVVQAERSSAAGASSFFPPLEQLAVLIPEAVKTESPTPPASSSSTESLSTESLSIMSSPIAGKEAMRVAQPQPQPQPKAATAPGPAPMTAQEKLQAALRSTAKPAARAVPAVSEELVAARAMAKEAAAPQPHHVVSRRIDGVAPVVKKVAFPRLDSDV
jgi:hypothetical protein